MASDQPNFTEMLPKFWRLFLLAASAIYLFTVLTFIEILRNPEWHSHLLRLMGRAWVVFVAQDVGSTGRGFINGGLEVVLGFAVVAAMTGYALGLKEFQKHLMETAIIGLFAFGTVTMLVYGTQFAWEVAKAGYQDHSNLATIAGQSGQLKTQVGQLTSKKSALEEKLAGKPTVITKTLPALPAPSPTPGAAPVERQCWLDNHFGMPNSTIKGAVTATAAIIHCNYRIDAPFKVTLEFDRDFIPGALTILGAGVVIDGGGVKQGLLYIGGADSPSLRSEQLVIVTVYGPTDQYPRAIRGKIEADQ